MVEEYDFWLFDLDGTLVDVEPSYSREVFERVGDRIGRSFTDREVDILWNGLTGSRDRQLERWGVDPAAFWQAFHEEEDPLVRAEQTYLHPDARVVADLDAPVALVTHCQRYLTEPVLETLDIADWFDVTLCCTDEIGWKPDPYPIECVMADLGVAHNGHEGILVGDGPNDVGAAWNAGIDAAHVERFGPQHRGQCVLGDYRVSRVDELL